MFKFSATGQYTNGSFLYFTKMTGASNPDRKKIQTADYQ